MEFSFTGSLFIPQSTKQPPPEVRVRRSKKCPECGCQNIWEAFDHQRCGICGWKDHPDCTIGICGESLDFWISQNRKIRLSLAIKHSDGDPVCPDCGRELQDLEATCMAQRETFYLDNNRIKKAHGHPLDGNTYSCNDCRVYLRYGIWTDKDSGIIHPEYCPKCWDSNFMFKGLKGICQTCNWTTDEYES